MSVRLVEQKRLLFGHLVNMNNEESHNQFNGRKSLLCDLSLNDE